MIVSDIIRHSKEFFRAHKAIYIIHYFFIGAAIMFTHSLNDIYAVALTKLETTYPPFMMVLTNIAAGSLLMFCNIVIIGLASLWLLVSLVIYGKQLSFAGTFFKQLPSVFKNLKYIYLFCLVCVGIGSLFAALIHFFFGGELSGYLFNKGGTGLLNLGGYIGDRFVECFTVFIALFCFSRDTKAPPLNYIKFGFSSLCSSPDVVYEGCKYYALLFGCVDFILHKYGLYDSVLVGFISGAWIVSMFLLANGAEFKKQEAN